MFPVRIDGYLYIIQADKKCLLQTYYYDSFGIPNSEDFLFFIRRTYRLPEDTDRREKNRVEVYMQTELRYKKACGTKHVFGGAVGI